MSQLPAIRFRGRHLFYGWAVVAAAFVADFLTYGIGTVAFTVFFNPMIGSLGWSRGLLSSSIVVGRIVEGVATPLSGSLVDRRGPQAIVALGAVLLAAGTIGLGLMQEPWHLYLAWAALAVGMATLGSTVTHTVVSKWFVRYRGRALSAVTMGYSLAGIVLPIPATFLILNFGWRNAWIALGAFALALGLVVAYLVRRRPEDHGLDPDGVPVPSPLALPASSQAMTVEPAMTAREAVRTPAFWLLVVGSNLGVMAVYGVNIHLVPFLNDKGFDAAIAAGIYTVLYSMQFLSKPLWGFLSERLPVRQCAALCYFGGGLGLLLALVAGTLPGVILFTIVYGLTRGAQALVMSIAWADYFGRNSLGTIRGISSPFALAASASGPVVAGFLFDWLGSYTVAFACFVAAFWGGAALVFLAQPPKKGELT